MKTIILSVVLLASIAAAQHGAQIVIDPAAINRGAAPAAAAAEPAAAGAGPAASAGAAAGTGTAGATRHAGGLAFPNNFGLSIPARGNPYGAKAYGLGLNNELAQPHNVREVSQLLTIAEQFPNVLVRIDVDGEVELTDGFGRVIETLPDQFGRDILELHGL